MLLHGCYKFHTGEEPDDGPVRGDHFLLEAWLRRRGGAPV